MSFLVVITIDYHENTSISLFTSSLVLKNGEENGILNGPVFSNGHHN